MAELRDLLVAGKARFLNSLQGADASFSGNVTAPKFIGALEGKASSAATADSATKLTTARTLSISGTAGGTAPTFNGTANVTLSVPKNISSLNRLSFTTTDNGTSPTAQSIVLNSQETDTLALFPGIGFHIPNRAYGTLKYYKDGSFRFYNSELTAYVPVYASTFHGNLSGNATSATSAGVADQLSTSIAFTPAETALTPDNVYDLIGSGSRIRRGTWSYAGNGYIAKGSTAASQCPFGAIDLAGTTVFQAGNAKTQYTQIYVTPPTASTTNAIKGEMLYYINNGEGYSPTWYRVLTDKNYTDYTVKKDGTGASGTWGINITGNANYATSAGTATSANTATSATYLTSQGANVANTRTQAHTQAVVTGGWASNDAGYGSTYGTTLDVSGYSTWYHRLAFHTNGEIDYWQGINTNTLTKVGRLLTSANYSSHLDSHYVKKAGDSMSGTLSWGGNVSSLNLRTGHASYDGVISYQTSGNEAMLFTTKNAVTSFMFVNGEDTITNMAADRWTKLTPGLQIKNNCVAIGGLIANDVSPTHKLWVNGTSKFSDDITLNNSNVNIVRAGISQSWYQGRNSAMIKTTSYAGYDSILSMKTTSGDWSLGVYNDNKLYFTYVLDSNYNAGTNTTTAQIRFDPDGTVVAPKFSGSLSGNATSATTATKLSTARSIFGHSFNGTADVAGQPLVYGSYNSTANTRYSTGGIQIRENGLVGNAQSDIAYAPAIGFHWGGRIAASLLFHSDGNFYFRKQNFTDRATIDANVVGSLSGNATTSSYPLGFSGSSTGNAGWGNQTGTTVVTWNDPTGGSVDWRRDNPSGGKISLKVDGRFYGNEGTDPAMLLVYKNDYYGMAGPDGSNTASGHSGDNIWIRTTSNGIIPYQGGGRGNGHCYLGTDSWYFAYGYIDNVYTTKTNAFNGFQVTNTAGNGSGLGLYGTSAPNSYGIHMSLTSGFGTHGPVSGDWANYFCFDGASNRGWIFKHAGTNVASISGTGAARFDDSVFGYAYNKSSNKAAFIWDKPGSNYTGVGANGTADTIYFGACTLEGAWVPSYKQKWVFNGTVSADSFNGTASAANVLSVNNTAKLSNCLQYIQTSSQTSGNDLPSATWYHVLKMNHGEGDTYYKRLMAFDFWDTNKVYTNLAAGNGTVGTWKKFWLEGDSVTGAVWNDYAECRESDCEDFGYVLMETGNDSLTKTTERLQSFAGISSDTWGFSQGETETAKTPIAVAGRVLAYPYQDRNNYKPGDCVCAAPGGTVDIMTREEVIYWPDRIVGTVSHVPEYEEWGGGEGADRGPVKVNGRIWIKVK